VIQEDDTMKDEGTVMKYANKRYKYTAHEKMSHTGPIRESG
jgi:hypothetical protein